MSINEPTNAPESVPQEPTTLTTGQKIRGGAYIAKCVIIGGIFTVGGIGVLFSGQSAWWAGLAAIAYGAWVLSGIKTGGWRLFIY
ncbi:MAG: hypothetical protein LBI33_09690 [Propionibacteriaceae bacterium]|jgi:hypothetical protein|nr:hypothetical protein [Propionibacteriaceae bacterium]